MTILQSPFEFFGINYRSRYVASKIGAKRRIAAEVGAKRREKGERQAQIATPAALNSFLSFLEMDIFRFKYMSVT
jgi:hypothetical protein